MGEAPSARVLRQLAEALLFEQIVDAEEDETPRGLAFGWSAGGSVFRCLGRRGFFGRVEVVSGTIEARAASGAWRPAGMGDLVEAVAGAPALGEKLLDELARTVAFCRWNAANLPQRDRRRLDFSALDRALDEGHPYHPCFKARTGFGEADHAAFGPEAGAAFRLVWLAVRRDLVASSLPAGDDAFWRAELGEAEAATLYARVEALGLDRNAVSLAPLHPWQWRALAHGDLAPLIAEGAVHTLGEAGPRYVASQSVRTLHNADDASRASVKLSMNMSTTSSLRTIDPHSVCVAPAISDWLAAVVAGDAGLAGRLAILREYAGVVVDRDGTLGPQLGAIWRESVASQLAAGEAAVPVNALMAEEADGRLFVAPWLDRYGAERWTERLIEIVAGPVWRLLIRHGIALEAHGQNMVLVHRDGWPERLILRDFHDSVEYEPGFLANPELLPDLAAIDPVYREAAPNRFHKMDSVEELRALVMDSLLVFCLSDLARALAGAGALPERRFRDLVEARLAAVSREADPSRADRLGWRRRDVAVERLLAPKLADGARRFVDVPNPFAPRSTGAAQPMIEIDGRSFDRDAIDTLSGRWADRIGLGRDGGGQRYAVRLPETTDWLAVLLAIREAGCGVLPIHPATPPAAARRLAQRAGCDRLVLGVDEIEGLQPEAAPAPGTLLQMSSGTTGDPKCVARGWAEIEREVSSYVESFREPDDMTQVVACPTTHSYGLICGVLAALKRGRSPKVVNVTNPKALIRTLRETTDPLLYSSPALLRTLSLLLPAGEKVHAVMTSGAFLPASWFAAIRDRSRFMFQQYGCSEAGVVAVNRDVASAEDMGRPLPHLSVTAGGSRDAPGEIVVEGFGRRVETRDLGYLKPDGTIVFLSRLDDTINVSGLNVYPGEVEDAAMASPAVSDAVAFRIADDFAGERVGLIVAGEAPIDEGALRDWLRSTLAPHQTPVEIIQVAAVPRQASGKVSRREIAALHAAGRLTPLCEAAQ